MDAIDLKGCPSDFQLAYKRHVLAWQALARVKASNEGFNGVIKSYLTGGLIALSGIADADKALQEIDRSWGEVQKSAIANGVSP